MKKYRYGQEVIVTEENSFYEKCKGVIISEDDTAKGQFRIMVKAGEDHNHTIWLKPEHFDVLESSK
jgi:hypothetical protein